MLQGHGALEKDNMSRLREIQRINRKSLREERRNLILKSRRLELDEVEEAFRTVTLDEMKMFAVELKKPNSGVLCMRNIQRALLCGEKHIEAFVSVEGALFALVGKLVCKDPQKVLEAVLCIVNLTCGPHKITYKIAKAAGAYLVTYILGSSCNLQNLCSWAVGNIVNDCECCFAILRAQGCLPALVSLLKSPYPEVMHSVVYALHACSKYQNMCSSDLLHLTLPEEIIRLLCDNFPNSAVVDAVFCLSNLCNLIGQEMSVEFQKRVGCVILTLLEKALSEEHFDIRIATAFMHCLGSLSSRSDEVCATLTANRKFESCMNIIMKSQFQHLKRALVWILSNIIVSKNLVKTWQIDLNAVISLVYGFLNPLDTGVLPALYFLCVLVDENSELREKLRSELITHVTPLLSCGKDMVEHAAQTFCTILNLESSQQLVHIQNC